MAVPTAAPSLPRTPAPGADGARVAPSARRRSFPLVAVGVLMAFAGALVFAMAYLSAGRGRAVLAVARAVPAGAAITDADLRETRVSGGEGLRPVASSERSAVVGKVATVALAPGTLLARSQFGSGVSLAPGQAVVGVALKAGQLPPGLRPGDPVMVVDTGIGRAGPGPSEARVSVLVPAATVFAVPAASDPTALTVVSLAVPALDAPRIAAAAAAERVSLVLLPHQS
jgi:hypothetical protein